MIAMPGPQRRDSHPGTPYRAARDGFTLIELLVVLAIVAILAALSAPVISSIQSSFGLETAAQQVSAQLDTARQYALTTSHPVQVRFYNLPDTTNPAVSAYRGMQCFVEGDNAVTPIGKPYFFPTPIVVVQATSNGTDISSLLTTGYSGIKTGNPPDTVNPLPPTFGTSYTYAYFHYRTNGQTDLSTTKSVNSLLTLAQGNAPKQGNALPANYVTLQLNSITGIVSMYRP
ncbi:MAG TPA: Verru_Chthon cassette protein D [Candidatus Methylacidiphilales bacterium]